MTDFVNAGEENTIALRLTTVRTGQLPRPGPVRLGEMRGFVIRNIAGVITARRDSPGEPLLLERERSGCGEVSKWPTTG